MVSDSQKNISKKLKKSLEVSKFFVIFVLLSSLKEKINIGRSGVMAATRDLQGVDNQHIVECT